MVTHVENTGRRTSTMVTHVENTERKGQYTC